MFLIDKYAPKTIKDVFFHKDILEQLITISKDNSIPHIIFYGPMGSGKRTLVRLFLEMLYGNDINRVHDSTYNVVGSGNSATEVVIKQSDHHIIIEPNNNNFDRYLIHDIVKTYAKKMPINMFVKQKKPFKIVLINNIDNLSYYAQTSLRRTMEIYSKNCRFILISTSLSKVIDPLVSRCLCFRVNSPPDTEIFNWVHKISLKENINLNIDQYSTIVHNSKGNIKEVLWELEIHKYGITKKSSYDTSIDKIIEVLYKSSLKTIYTLRTLIYEISITNISEKKIIKDILDKLICDNSFTLKNKYRLIKNASKYEYNFTKGRRAIMHLEAFIQTTMQVIRDNKKELHELSLLKQSRKVEK